LISHQFYHPHPDPPPSRGRAISGIARVIGQPAKPCPLGIDFYSYTKLQTALKDETTNISPRIAA
jgi:hypothetical protein